MFNLLILAPCVTNFDIFALDFLENEVKNKTQQNVCNLWLN